MKFHKYQGTGNDFIIIDDRDESFPLENEKYVKGLCQRRFGIGADGLILIREHKSAGFDMLYFNADGKPGSMCGNGGRCAAKFAHSLGIFQKEISFNAFDGIHSASLNDDATITISMCPVSSVEKLEANAWFIDTGSPHYVYFPDESFKHDFVEASRKVRLSPPYKKEGVNVNFVWPESEKNLNIRTYERGVEAETWSCGTGIVASAIAACEKFEIPIGKNEFKVSASGGTLFVTLDVTDNGYKDIQLTGPAVFTFSGELP